MKTIGDGEIYNDSQILCPVPIDNTPNGNTDDVMIRLPEAFRTNKDGAYSHDIYKANLAIAEAMVKGFDSITALPIDENVIGKDLNGDGISDVVVVTATQVKYAINRNGDRFDPFVTITSADVDGNLPERQMGDKVLYADMNANGSQDVVWFDTSGQVQYLELFPVRPNLLSRIENNIGSVQKIDYTTSAIQEATAREGGDPWSSSLSIPMNIVASTDTYVTLTGKDDGSGLHERVDYLYRDGFYDGVEKQFRGFERVEMQFLSDRFVTCEKCGGQRFKPEVLANAAEAGRTDPGFDTGPAAILEISGAGWGYTESAEFLPVMDEALTRIEALPDEGDMDFYKVLKALKNVGYSYGIDPDHVPRTDEDPKKYYQSYAYCFGYINAMIQAVYGEDD